MDSQPEIEGGDGGDDEPLRHWRQGDFALDVGGFLYAKEKETAEGEHHFDAAEEREETCKAVGLIVITQTCDIIRREGGKNFVSVCPLVQRDDKEVKEIKKGYRPYFADVENIGDNVFADLRRVMSVSKDLLRTWKRHDGFTTESKKITFAASLERYFGRFAFPDDFDSAINDFKKRVWQRHDKQGSEPGSIYRSLLEIRFRAAPSWEAEKRKITLIALLGPLESGITREKIRDELSEQLAKVKWPEGYEWAAPEFILQSPKYLTAEDYINSQRADFDFLCC